MTTPSEKDYLAANLGVGYWRTMVRVLTTERDNWRTKAEQRSYRIHELENKNTRLRVERDHLYSQGIGTALAEANARIAALEAENTKLRGDLDVALAAVERENAEANRLKAENAKLHGQLDALAQRRDPPGSYVVRTPGVYYAYTGDHDRELHVVKHDAKDTVFANVDLHRGWNYVDRDMHGKPYIMAPSQRAQEAIHRVVTPIGDLRVVNDPGAHSGRMYSDAESNALREQIMQPGLMAKVGIDPGKGDDLTTVMQTTLTRLDRMEADQHRCHKHALKRIEKLEEQMAAKLTEVSHPTHEMAQRVDRLEREKMAILERENSLFGKVARLEGWARQFHPTQSTAILATPIGGRYLAIDPLDHLEHKG